MNSRLVISLAVIVAAIVGGVVWFLQSAPEPVATALPTTPPPLAPRDPVAPAVAATPTAPLAKSGQLPPPLPGATQSTETDRKIDEILRLNPDNSDAAHLATAQMLINLLPTLPPEGQAEAAQHISNLLPDKEYARVRPMVLNASAPQELLDVFVTDLMNREDAVKLPVLLEIAKMPNHPTREEALTDLQIFLDGDFGTDWGKWDTALKAYLKKQRDEAAATPLIGK